MSNYIKCADCKQKITQDSKDAQQSWPYKNVFQSNAIKLVSKDVIGDN